MSGGDVFDRIAASRPVNQSAARAVSQKGIHYQFKPSTARLHSPDVLPVASTGNPNDLDLIGVRFGRLTVIGRAALQNPKKRATYVCRCVCGAYEHRKAKAIQNPLNAEDRCSSCQHLLKLQMHGARQ